jgi:hypothetical protein
MSEPYRYYLSSHDADTLVWWCEDRRLEGAVILLLENSQEKCVREVLADILNDCSKASSFWFGINNLLVVGLHHWVLGA